MVGLCAILFAFCLCAALTLALYIQEIMDGEAYAKLQFDRRVELRKLLIEEGMFSYEQLLVGGVGLFAADEVVTSEEWRRFVETARLEKRFPGVLGLGYAMYLPTQDRDKLEATQRQSGSKDFVIWPVTDEAYSTPIVLLEPSNWRNERAIGFDMFAEKVRRSAMLRAMAKGIPVMSDNVILVQETLNHTQSGFLVYAPVYQTDNGQAFDGEGLSPEARAQQLLGFVFSPFRMNDLIWSILETDHLRLVRLQIFDGSSEQGALIFDSLGGREPQSGYESWGSSTLPSASDTAMDFIPAYVSSSRFRFARNNWTLKFSSLPAFESSIARTRHNFILAGGLLISALVAMIVAYWFAMRQRARALSLSNASLQAALMVKRQLIAAMEGTSDIIFFCNETGYISYLNYRGRALMAPGLSASMSPYDITDLRLNIHDCMPEWATAIINSESFPYALANGGWSGDIAIHSQGGREVPVALILEAHFQADGRLEFFAGNMRDISRRKAIHADLEHKAYHDELTGLVNRQGFNERLERAIVTANVQNAQSALLFIDLDHFKQVNDACGHAAGDEVLVQLSTLFGRQLRDRDTLARLGGDEFAVILEHCRIVDAEQIAENIVQATSDFRFFREGKTFRFGASIGLVPINRHSGTPKQVMNAVDEAAYKAKSNGRSQVVVNETGIETQGININWGRRLRTALKQDLFELVYQPIVPVDSAYADIKLREVLIRLKDEDRLIEPAAFLPEAERLGLMCRLDMWVIGKIAAKLQAQKDVSPGGEIYAINLSPQSLGEVNFADRILTVVAEHGVDPASICFELTENMVLQNPQASREFIKRMKDFGLQITLEHFGMSISEFVSLNQLGVDYLKIDSWFIQKMLRSEIDDQSIRFINTMGHTMGLRTIAGAVSDPAIEARLREMGVDFLQGFQIAEPGPDIL